ncbi:uncharacterized protein N7518_002729 [Penicillium psychrosexuale]|uniref:uncharacterized protein n=1 Tax=Penicillium psychrosexuale TaxID=1002107 RepID=UPI0025457889|nr:uncharacterized protein N7518_002729 [Penicillium psychrosexuale]KAJ5800661.1 hypothetical protein N7518_002729 [Penicillium psychrosexuale]
MIGDIDGIKPSGDFDDTQKLKERRAPWEFRIIAMFLHGNLSDVTPTRLNIQKTTSELRP